MPEFNGDCPGCPGRYGAIAMNQKASEAASAVSRILPVSKSNSDPLLDSIEAAAYIGVSPASLAVWRSVKRYPLSFVKIGSRVKYRKSDLDAFIASRTQGAEVSK